MVTIQLQRPCGHAGARAGNDRIRSPLPLLRPLPVPLAMLLLLAAVWNRAAAQPADPAPDEIIETLERALEGGMQESSDDTELLDELERYRRRPINLYTTTADSLARLPGISIQDARVILDVVDSAAPSQIQELEAIERLDAGQLQILRTYTSLRHPRMQPPAQRTGVALRARFQQDLQPRRGYTGQLLRVIPRRDAATGDSLGVDTIGIGAPYLGGRAGILARVMASHGDFSGGVTFERDPGEPFIAADTASLSYAPYEYADPAGPHGKIERRPGGFLSAHAAGRFGPFTFHVGDYSAEFGQGLLFGGSFGGTKGGEVIETPYKSPGGITSYSSAGENGFYRGAALGFSPGGPLPGSVEACIFWSQRSLDATLEEIPDASGAARLQAGTIREDGYHRTRSELRRSGTLDETLLGGNIGMNIRGGDIGITAYTSRFSIPSAETAGGSFDAGRTTMVGVHGRYARWGALLFGEVARATDGTIGVVGGISSSLGRVDLTVAGRYLPPSFSTPHGTGFGEAPARQHNERGIYIAARAMLLRGLSLSAYFDYYTFPERSGLVPFPRTGADGYLQFDYNPTPYLKLYGRIRSETKGAALTLADSLHRERKRVLERTSTSGRLSAEYLARGGAIRLRVRMERRFVSYNGGVPPGGGVLTFADLRLRPIPSVAIGGRVALFDTDDFDAAIYEFEQEVPGRLTNLALSGEGRRFYLYAVWSPSPTFSIAAKYGETVYADRDSISPGTLQEISGRVNNALAVQMDLRL